MIRGGNLQEEILKLLSARKGHFLLESGHHGDLWLDLELLCRRPRVLEPLAAELARRLFERGVDVICGPLVEGSFIALLVASKLDAEFAYTERFARPSEDGLFPAGYRIPSATRDMLRGRRVAIVNDVTNAGSAVKGTFADLENCGAIVVAIASLLVLGDSAGEFAASHNIPLIRLTQLQNTLWVGNKCPLCASGLPLEDVGSFAKTLQSSQN